MPIPLLDKRGLLPEGIHDATVDEIRSRFAISEYRQLLFADFLTFIHQEIDSKEPVIYMAGSFLSDKLLPNDIELTVSLDVLAIQTPTGLKLIKIAENHDLIKEKYRIDFYVSFGIPGCSDFRQFFQYVGDKTAQAKGLNAKDKRGIIKII